jgi:putative PEP-CTERM system TPR-repeat lipoprotein
MRQSTPFHSVTPAARLAVPLALWLAGCEPTPRTDADYLAQARALLDGRQHPAALVALKNALQKNPDNAEARALLGRVQVELGQAEAAEKELRRAIELGVPKADLLIPLAEALRLQGKNQTLVDELFPDDSRPAAERATVLALRGDAWLALGKPDRARHDYDEGLAADPAAPLARLGFARLALVVNDPDEAGRRVAEALAEAPAEPRLWSFQAALWEQAEDFEKAEAAYGKTIELRRDNRNDRVHRALVRIALGRYADAARDIGILKREVPDGYLTHYADGWWNLRQNRYEAAQTALETAERLNRQHDLTVFQLGVAHLAQNHLVQAEQYLSRFLQMAPGSVGGIELLALTRFRRQQFESVRLLLAPVIDVRPDDRFALNLLGNAELALGQVQAGIDHLQKWVELEPGSAPARRDLGRGLLAGGRYAEGLAELRTSADLDPAAKDPGILMALTHLRAREFDQALAAIKALAAKDPASEIPETLRGLVHLARNEPEKAAAAWRAALEKKPGDPSLSHRLAQLALAQNQPAQARALYEQALAAHPEDLSTQLRLAQIDALQGRFKDLGARMEAAIKEHPEALQPRLVRAETLLRFGQPDRAQALLEQIRGRHPRHPDLLALLVRAQLDNRQPQHALHTAKALAEAAPGSAKAHYLLALVQGELGDASGMRRALERSLATDAGFLPAREAEVRVLALEKKPGEAQAKLDRLAQEYPDAPEVLLLKGGFALARNRPEAAVTAYRRALALAPGTHVVTKLAQALWKSGDRQGAIDTLETWCQSHADDSYGRYVLAGLYRAENRPEPARRRLEEVLAISPKNALAMNDLAWLLRGREPQRALELAEQAAEAMPQSPAILDTLALVLMDLDQAERALPWLRRAAELAPADPAIGRHLAQALSKTGGTR